jgi:hypothetical protein
MRLAVPALSFLLEPSQMTLPKPILPIAPLPGASPPRTHRPRDTLALRLPSIDTTLPSHPLAHARIFDEVTYSDKPTKLDETMTRFILNNPNGVTRDGSYDHMSEYLLELLEIGIDVIQFPVSNVDWRSPGAFKACQKAVKPVFNHAKLRTSSSSKRTVTAKQPGGTLTIGVENFSGRISETGRDAQYGRWSYFQNYWPTRSDDHIGHYLPSLQSGCHHCRQHHCLQATTYTS